MIGIPYLSWGGGVDEYSILRFQLWRPTAQKLVSWCYTGEGKKEGWGGRGGGPKADGTALTDAKGL